MNSTRRVSAASVARQIRKFATRAPNTPGLSKIGAEAVGGPAFDKVEYVDGLENPTENFANICGRLVADGFSDEEISKALGGNILRALGEIWV